MGQSLPLFDTPMSRDSDPDSSKEAADQFRSSGKREAHCRHIMELLLIYPFHTSLELANRPRAQLDRYQIARRLPELEAEQLVRRAGMRKCNIGEGKAETWHLTDLGRRIVGHAN